MARKTSTPPPENNGTRTPKTICNTLRDLRLPIGLFVVILLLYFFVYLYQSRAVIRDANFQHREVIDIPDGHDSLQLDVTYPQTLRLDQTRAHSQTVTLALWHTTAPTTTRPYTVGFTVPLTTVVLADLDGNRIQPWFTITPTSATASPVACCTFLIQRTLFPEGEPAQITPALHLQTASGTDLLIPEGQFKPIALQSQSEAWWSRFRSLVLGPTTPLLTAAAGLVVLSVEEIRRWQTRRIEAEERTRQQEEEAQKELRRQEQEEKRKKERRSRKIAPALTEIRALELLLQTDISKGAHRYESLSARTDPLWRDRKVKSQLKTTWKKNAPPELQHAVELLSKTSSENQFYDTVTSIGIVQSAKTLEWAMDHLDDEWRLRTCAVCLRLGKKNRGLYSSETLGPIMQKPWQAILRIWPHISLWRGLPPPTDSAVVRGLRYLGLKTSPFGSEQAETDALLAGTLLESRKTYLINPPCLEELFEPAPAFVVGAPGSGKTATALILAYEALRGKTFFPVYYPVTLDDFKLCKIGQALAQTLVSYLATAPAAFLKQDITGKTSIMHLLALCAPSDLALQCHLAGLPPTGEGAQLLQEIEKWIQDRTLEEPVTDEGWLRLLSEARPRGFPHIAVLFDVREQTGEANTSLSDELTESLFDLSNSLARVGIFVKTFLPDTLDAHLNHCVDQQLLTLRWSDSDLRELLEYRLRLVDEALVDMLIEWVVPLGKDATPHFKLLGGWCDPREGDLPLDGRLIGAAQGTPGGLIQKGNALLRRIGQEQRRLTLQDLDQILGPPL